MGETVTVPRRLREVDMAANACGRKDMPTRRALIKKMANLAKHGGLGLESLWEAEVGGT